MIDQPDPGAKTNTPDPGAKTEAQDPIAYRIAIATIGFALVAFLIGAAIIAAGGKPVPTQYWTTGSSISGALLGILAPTPKKAPEETRSSLKFLGGIVNAWKDLWNNRALVILLAVFGASLGFGISHNSPELLGVAAAAGGALIGLLAPSPASTSVP